MALDKSYIEPKMPPLTDEQSIRETGPGRAGHDPYTYGCQSTGCFSGVADMLCIAMSAPLYSSS